MAIDSYIFKIQNTLKHFLILYNLLHIKQMVNQNKYHYLFNYALRYWANYYTEN